MMDPMIDLRIWKNLLAAFQRESRLNTDDISIAVRDGVVSLVGTVRSFPEKELASEVASKVSGVVGVQNDLRVVPAVARTDADIAAGVRRALDEDQRLDLPSRIAINVEGGVVTLNGTLESLDERQMAAEDARKVPGVIDVVNQLQVVPDVIRRDAELQNDANRKLYEDIIVDASTIEIHVNNGIVTLSGTVPTGSQKRAAEDDVWSIDGVRGVVNELTVQNPPPP